MFERIHQKLGTAGFVISIIALVAALGGGAYAATGNGAGQATASAKAKQGKQGKPGKPGKTGPAGPAGPAGPQGPAGPAGAKGDTGAAGATGKEGPQGKEGIQGKEGSPWTAGGTLPTGTVVSGTWISTAAGEYANSPVANISFPLPAKEGKAEAGWVFTISQIANGELGAEEQAPDFFAPCKVEAGNPSCVDTGCNGNTVNPTAPAGTLCVYATYEWTNAAPGSLLTSTNGEFSHQGYGPRGTAIIPVSGGYENAAHYDAYGIWALKAP